MNPLNPREVQILAQLQQRAQANGQSPMLATLNPPDNGTRYFGGVPFRETPIKDPKPWLAVDQNIGYMLNDRISTISGVAANTQTIVRQGFDVPSAVFALTGTAIDTTGAALPVGLDPLDTFTVQFVLTNGQRWQTVAGLGSTILGTAQRPRYLGGPCWILNNGAVMQVIITPLRANLRIDVNMMVVEQPGPTNIAAS